MFCYLSTNEKILTFSKKTLKLVECKTLLQTLSNITYKYKPNFYKISVYGTLHLKKFNENLQIFYSYFPLKLSL